MNGKIKYDFLAKTWKHCSAGGWVFVSLPLNITSEIKEHLKWQEERFGRLKIIAEIGNNKWDTAIWFDTKYETYLLPLKLDIRKKEKINTGDIIQIIIWI